VDSDFLTSAEAAELMGVSPSTIKRWVDEGELEAERTAGGHRRIRRALLEAFRSRLAGLDPATEGPASRLVDLLISEAPSQLVEARLLELRAGVGSAAALGDWLSPSIREIGERWRSGRISVLEEHLASERLARALARLTEWVPLAQGAPRALLATAQGDDHTLGLSLVELCLREAGWETLWTGRNTPVPELVRTVRDAGRRIKLVAISASVASQNTRALALEERTVGAACASVGAALLIGGAGAWPERPKHAQLIRELRALDRAARELHRA